MQRCTTSDAGINSRVRQSYRFELSDAVHAYSPRVIEPGGLVSCQAHAVSRPRGLAGRQGVRSRSIDGVILSRGPSRPRIKRVAIKTLGIHLPLWDTILDQMLKARAKR